MSLDNILFWTAFGIVMLGEVVTFSRRWWDKGYMVLSLGLAVLAVSALVRGQWPWDFALAALAAVSGLGIIYVAFWKERKRGKSEVGEGQADGQLSEGAGDRP